MGNIGPQGTPYDAHGNRRARHAVDYDFPWENVSAKTSLGFGLGSIDRAVARRVDVGFAHLEFVVCRRLDIGFGRVDEAIVFDRVDVGMGRVGKLHCLASTRQEVGLGSIQKVEFHSLGELVQMARSCAGMPPSAHPETHGDLFVGAENQTSVVPSPTSSGPALAPPLPYTGAQLGHHGPVPQQQQPAYYASSTPLPNNESQNVIQYAAPPPPSAYAAPATHPNLAAPYDEAPPAYEETLSSKA